MRTTAPTYGERLAFKRRAFLTYNGPVCSHGTRTRWDHSFMTSVLIADMKNSSRRMAMRQLAKRTAAAERAEWDAMTPEQQTAAYRSLSS